LPDHPQSRRWPGSYEGFRTGALPPSSGAAGPSAQRRLRREVSGEVGGEDTGPIGAGPTGTLTTKDFLASRIPSRPHSPKIAKRISFPLNHLAPSLSDSILPPCLAESRRIDATHPRTTTVRTAGSTLLRACGTLPIHGACNPQHPSNLSVSRISHALSRRAAPFLRHPAPPEIPNEPSPISGHRPPPYPVPRDIVWLEN
jgi:hypothetical protein